MWVFGQSRTEDRAAAAAMRDDQLELWHSCHDQAYLLSIRFEQDFTSYRELKRCN